jgi:hypothetical protein
MPEVQPIEARARAYGRCLCPRTEQRALVCGLVIGNGLWCLRGIAPDVRISPLDPGGGA